MIGRASGRLPRAQGGQALTEFLAVALALVPLFLLVPLIAKYQDISHATQLASRYVAFEAMTRNDTMSSWKPEAELAQDVRRRFFSNPDAPIKTGDAASDIKAHQNPFWRDPADQALIRSFGNDITVSFGESRGASHGSAFSNASDEAPFLLSGPLSLQSRGIYTANVTVSLARLPSGLRFYEPFDQLDLVMSRSTSVLIDPWTARDPDAVDGRVGGNASVFPVGALSAISPVVEAGVALIEWPGGVRGPQLGQLDFWQDVVPEDRIK